jgi:uncharacterized membrane protein YvbJ
MAACPNCGRALATGARTCVYCAQGTTFQRRQELKVPEGALKKRKRGLPWGMIILVLILLGAVAAYFRPEVRPHVDGLIQRVKAFFG